MFANEALLHKLGSHLGHGHTEDLNFALCSAAVAQIDSAA